MESIEEKKNPTELLALQYDNLNKLVQIQSEQLEKIRTQNENLVNFMNSISKNRDSNGNFQIKIQDFNMPFMALVGLIVKITFASIPAAIIIFVSVMVFSLLFGGFFGALGSLLN